MGFMYCLYASTVGYFSFMWCHSSHQSDIAGIKMPRIYNPSMAIIIARINPQIYVVGTIMSWKVWIRHNLSVPTFVLGPSPLHLLALGRLERQPLSTLCWATTILHRKSLRRLPPTNSFALRWVPRTVVRFRVMTLSVGRIVSSWAICNKSRMKCVARLYQMSST